MKSETTAQGDMPISAILAQTELLIHPDSFMLVGLSLAERSRIERDLQYIRSDFFQYIVEPDVVTLLLDEDSWELLSRRYPEARLQGPLNLFTFSLAMDWEVVGFLAAITSVLAEAGIPLGAVCGYDRDHLFIAAEYTSRAEKSLRAEMERVRIISFNREEND